MANGKAELTLKQLYFAMDHGQHDSDCALFDGTVSSTCNCALDLFRRDVLIPAIAEAERIDKLHGWVPVSERLPKCPPGCCSKMLVLIRLRADSYDQAFGRYFPSTNRFCDNRAKPLSWKPTHWRELPSLPEEADIDNETTEAKLEKYDRATYGDPYKPRDIG